MNTIHLSDSELTIVRHAMRSYLNSFGHDEADVVALIKQVIARLSSAEREPSAPQN